MSPDNSSERPKGGRIVAHGDALVAILSYK